MNITIKLSAQLKRYTSAKDGKLNIIVKDETTVLDVLSKLKILPGEVGFIILNSRIVNEEAILKDRDILELYPVLGGG